MTGIDPVLSQTRPGEVNWSILSALTQASGSIDFALENQKNNAHTLLMMNIDDSYEQNTSF
eukprot:10748464-Ditylum_brightwellii.AAC.1